MSFSRDDDGPLAVLTLDHGELNLFDRQVFGSLAMHVDALANDPPRGLLITAAGRMTSAGVDVHEFENLTPTADLFDADTLAAWNVVNLVLPDKDLRDRALEIATNIASGPTRAHAATKQLIRTQTQLGTRAADALAEGFRRPVGV